MIEATMTSDCGTKSVMFDCQEWFENATYIELRSLFETGLSDTWITDEVGESCWCDPEVWDFLEWVDSEEVTTTCTINREQATKWVRENLHGSAPLILHLTEEMVD